MQTEGAKFVNVTWGQKMPPLAWVSNEVTSVWEELRVSAVYDRSLRLTQHIYGERSGLRARELYVVDSSVLYLELRTLISS